ncbi:MAG: hypothetical protein HBSAPP04_00470 [Ignavibacteriaceae bacterium]|nr:MAG: hypothetical protein HBSAPP04_00470 [Ignavibacteriaceae bacterium]
METKKTEPKISYVKPAIIAVTDKTSMSGARCPTHDVSWKQVTCRC